MRRMVTASVTHRFERACSVREDNVYTQASGGYMVYRLVEAYLSVWRSWLSGLLQTQISIMI